MIRPHPAFAKSSIPAEHALGAVRLKVLSVEDNDRDFRAIMDSADEIKAANPALTWPDGLTPEKNLIDLAWHQTEFRRRRSFAWVMEAEDGAYLGCLYVYPELGGMERADVYWWWRTGVSVDRGAFREDLTRWLAGEPWPRLDYRILERAT